MGNCSNIQKSMAWCQGAPVLPGIKKRIFFLPKSAIVQWPTLPIDENGKPTSSTYQGNFTLAEGEKWKFIDHLPSKAEFKSETQGEMPSQTYKNTLAAVHPDVGEEATDAAACLANSDNVYLVEDMKSRIRVVGSQYYETVTTVSQDAGQGPAGSAGTTINVEASDIVPNPFYTGEIETESGTINAQPAQA